jgi:Xaa-Pro aminopeptidase
MLNSRIKKLQKILKSPLLITNTHDLFYLTGRVFSDGGFLLVTKKEAVLLGGYLEDTKNIKVDSFKNLSKYVRAGQTILLDNQTSIKHHEWIQKHAPKNKLKPLSSPVKTLRLIKTSDELAKMKYAYIITTKVFAEVKRALQGNKRWTEKTLASFIRIAGLHLGADDISFPVIVASGANSAIPHHVPSEKALKAGESIVLDFGFKVDGYCSDFTRTVFIKSAPAQLRIMYEATERSYQAAIKAIRNKINASKLDAAAIEILDLSGFGEYFIHNLGHGTGLQVHEAPSLSPNSKDVLKDSMVFSIEPGVYIPRLGGIRIEDLVYIKNNKVKFFKKVSTKLEDCIIK